MTDAFGLTPKGNGRSLCLDGVLLLLRVCGRGFGVGVGVGDGEHKRNRTSRSGVASIMDSIGLFSDFPAVCTLSTHCAISTLSLTPRQLYRRVLVLLTSRNVVVSWFNHPLYPAQAFTSSKVCSNVSFVTPMALRTAIDMCSRANIGYDGTLTVNS